MHDRRWFMRIGRPPVETMLRVAQRVEMSVARPVEEYLDRESTRQRDIEESQRAETDAKFGPSLITPLTLP